MISNIKIVNVIEKENERATIYLNFNYNNMKINASVEKYHNNHIYLYRDDIQIYNGQKFIKFNYTEDDYFVLELSLQHYFYNQEAKMVV